MLLYKYLPPERLDVLKTLKIRFTQPCAFNDPFEGRPVLENDLDPDDEDVFSGLPMEMREELSRKIGGDAYNVHQLLFRQTFILSLAKSEKSLLMWAHYAADHTGFVIGLDSNHSFFAPYIDLPFYKLRQVVYSVERPRDRASEKDWGKSFCTKSIEWEYEQEWRLFRHRNQILDANPQSKDQRGYQVYLFALPPEAIQRVIVGCQASDDTLNKIQVCLKNNRNLRHVKLEQAVCNEYEYRIGLHPVE